VAPSALIDGGAALATKGRALREDYDGGGGAFYTLIRREATAYVR